VNSSSSSSLSSVQKACRILSALSDPSPHRLSNIIASTGLNKATVLRLLETLAGEGFVIRDPADKCYALGNEALVMKAAVTQHAQFPECARPSLVRLARVSEDAACLSITCGNYAVCIDREEGAYPLCANYLHIGRRLPLGVGSAALAMLAWLPDDEIDRIMERNCIALARFPLVSVGHIRREILAARERGYTLSRNVVYEGTGGIAVPILDRHGRPVAALSTTALAERLTTRQDMLANHLHTEAAMIEASLHRSGTAIPASLATTAAPVAAARLAERTHVRA
jgi:DNA-binding IclR family transcriptional regulator